MKKPIIREVKGPEDKIQEAITEFLELRGWCVMPTHGNLYQRGFPDLYCTHPKHKQRWIEVKVLENYSFTNSQLKYFPLISKAVGIWILVDATESEYTKLFGPPNWWTYLKLLKGR